MRRTTIAVLGLVLLSGILSWGSCKKAEVETGTLTVIVSEGVSGSPAAGTYTLNVGDTQSYSYSLEAGRQKLTVLLDGEEVAASGMITIASSHTLQAYSDDNRQYKLSVSWGSGVTGTPASGTYLHKQGTSVPYTYALADGYTNLSVKVDGSNVAASGTVAMSADHTLYAGAEVKQDVRGSWTLTEAYEDGSSFVVTVTFSGSLTGGTVTDSEGGSGTYEFSDSTVDFSLVFPDVTYTYSNGDFSDDNTMSGDCQRYQDVNNAVDGTWSATRNAATTASRRTATGAQKKGNRR